MNKLLGMDPGAVIIKRDAMQAQINALTSIASDLSSTYAAAHNPQRFGIDPGERTVAPWSINHVSSARTLISQAHSAAGDLLAKLSSEVSSQQNASAANGWDIVSGGFGFLKSVSWWRRFISWPRTLLELPAALQMIGMQGRPGLNFGFRLSNWWLAGSARGGAALRTFTMASETPYWIRALYSAGNNLKIQNLVNPDYLPNPSLGSHVRPPAWMDGLKIADAGVVSKIGKTITVVGKGFAVLGAVSSAVQLGTGIAGMMDGDITSEDKWAVADGAVGLITSIGSLAPPPVGLAFAAVGIAYTASRWLFGADENGKTGIDKIGDFGKSAGQFLGGAAKNTGKFVNDAVTNVGKAASDALANVGKAVLKSVWPWG